MIASHPLLGAGLHAVGAFLSANCYAPQKFVKRWSWEIMKGVLLSLLAGVLSAVYGFALEVAAPVVELAEQRGAGVGPST